MLRKIKWIGGFMIVAGLMFTACQDDPANENGDQSAEQGTEQMTDQQQMASNQSQANNQRANREASANNRNARENQNNRQQAEVPEGPKTTMSFNKMSHDFGTIDEGERVRHEFTFTNSGEEPLIISNAKGSCGCTVPNWPKDPVPPGETGVIEVEYNSRGKGKVGGRSENKTVTVTANTDPPRTRLKISANVVKEEEK